MFATDLEPHLAKYEQQQRDALPAHVNDGRAMVERVAKQFNLPVPLVYVLPDGVTDLYAGATESMNIRAIILNERIWTDFGPESREVIVGHEMAHLGASDVLRKWGIEVAGGFAVATSAIGALSGVALGVGFVVISGLAGAVTSVGATVVATMRDERRSELRVDEAVIRTMKPSAGVSRVLRKQFENSMKDAVGPHLDRLQRRQIARFQKRIDRAEALELEVAQKEKPVRVEALKPGFVDWDFDADFAMDSEKPAPTAVLRAPREQQRSAPELF